MTQENLQDAVVADLETLFKTYKLTNSQGVERVVRVFPQDLPIREGGDEETDPQAPPEPYVVVRLRQGELPAADTQQTVDVVLAVCVHDPDPNRQGYRDTLHIVNEIMRHYALYECTQIQRRYERNIRKAKEKYLMAKAFNDKRSLQPIRNRVGNLTRQYKQFSNACDLPIKFERLRVKDYN